MTGFRWALEREYEFVFEMDADFSHDPKHLPQFLEAARNADLVLGSRYLRGRVTVVNWPMGRLLLSYFANIYARVVTGLHLYDATGGFKCFRRRVLEGVALDRVRSNGYAFQIEMSFRAWRKGFRVVEIPIVFTDRADGTSKMSGAIVREAVWMVWRLRLMALLGRVYERKRQWARAIECYQRSLEHNAQYELAKASLRRLRSMMNSRDPPGYSRL